MGRKKEEPETVVDRHLLKKIKKEWKEKKMLKMLERVKKQAESEVVNEKVDVKQDQLSTFSIAVPGSIMENAQSLELQTYLAGQIARASCIFNVNEVVVYDDIGTTNVDDRDFLEQDDGCKVTTRPCCIKLARILQYLECPQYLRKHFFPIHKDLKYAGLLNPLDAPHHLRRSDNFPFRDGIILQQSLKASQGSIVNVGLTKNVRIDCSLTPGLRVTVQLDPPQDGSRKLRGKVVSPLVPPATGTYWGYSVRIAPSLSAVFSQSPYPEGYDLTIGTSDKGTSVDSLSDQRIPPYHHALAVFGGLEGLEAALEVDETLGVDNPELLFDWYLNTCPHQGSRTIRTEEAIVITLAALRTKLVPKFVPSTIDNKVA